MLDTLFLVLSKKNIEFLHWFHHLSVALYCCYTIKYPISIGYWFSLMNMFVHSIMYGYFSFSSELKRLTWFNPMYITILQIVQMYMGLVISLLYTINENTKYDTPTLLQLSYTFVMYSSYLYLFCKFFQSKYKFEINWYNKKNA